VWRLATDPKTGPRPRRKKKENEEQNKCKTLEPGGTNQQLGKGTQKMGKSTTESRFYYGKKKWNSQKERYREKKKKK